jgi:hypothetical protein
MIRDTIGHMEPDEAPATKRDLRELEERLTARFDGQLEQMEERLRNMHGELQEQMRDMQTELLRAFQPWQDNTRIQFQELKVNTGNSVQAITQRMDIMERRLLEIERKLLLNPPAA